MLILQPFLLPGSSWAAWGTWSKPQLCGALHAFISCLKIASRACAWFEGLREGWGWQVSGKSLWLKHWFTPVALACSRAHLKLREEGR